MRCWWAISLVLLMSSCGHIETAMDLWIFKNTNKEIEKEIKLIWNENASKKKSENEGAAFDFAYLKKRMEGDFGTNVVRDTMQIGFEGVKIRKKKDEFQYFAEDVLAEINQKNRDNSYHILLTDMDIFPHVAYNFCFGKANKALRAAVISKFRFKDNADFEKNAIENALNNTVIHEMGHLAGLKHCSEICLMAEAKDLKESIGRSAVFCERCKAKLAMVKK